MISSFIDGLLANYALGPQVIQNILKKSLFFKIINTHYFKFCIYFLAMCMNIKELKPSNSFNLFGVFGQWKYKLGSYRHVITTFMNYGQFESRPKNLWRTFLKKSNLIHFFIQQKKIINLTLFSFFLCIQSWISGYLIIKKKIWSRPNYLSQTKISAKFWIRIKLSEKRTWFP